MARQQSANKELDDMTECSICTEVFTDPRVLPCIHTFCLKCLLSYGKNRQPGDRMPCPQCRKEFTIGEKGLSGTPKNFFVEKLLHARRLSAGPDAQRIPCDVCRSDEANAGVTSKPASMYCVQCQQNFCDQCSLHHRKIKTSSGHTQVGAGGVSKPEEILKLSVNMCEEHKGKEIEMFCRECNVAACTMCVIMSHKTHECLAVEKASEDLRNLLLTDNQKVSKQWKATEDVVQRLEKRKKDITKHLAGIKYEINTAADELIAAIQRDREKLVAEVESIKVKRVKQVETMKQEMKQNTAVLDGFRRYGEMVLGSGTTCDVAMSSSSLHERAEELTKFDVVRHVDKSLPPVNVVFTSSALLGDNLLGTVTEEDSPTVNRIIPRGNEVATVGDDIFVMRNNSQEQIDVYNATNFTLRRHITVPGLGYSTGLAACTHNNCLYASDHMNDRVHRVNLSGRNAVMKWSVARHPAALSVNNEHNLLVVSQGESKLQIFTTHGTLLQSIQLQDDIEYPRQAVQLPTGQFLVSHSGSLVHRVCVVGAGGAVVRNYGGQKGSRLTQMNEPRGLAVDGKGRVLVADRYNNRLLVVDLHSLSSAREMSVCVQGGLKDPCSLWFDQARGRLFIGEDQGKRVIAIDSMKNFSAAQVK